MNRQKHYISFLLIVIPFFLIYSVLNYKINYTILKGLIFSGVVMNPDYFELNKKVHRWFISHSIIFPTFVYFCLRDLVNMEYATMLGVILYFPVMIHLIGDLKGTYGYGLIDCYPFRHLTHKESVIFILCNVILMFGLIFFWLN